MRTVLEYFSDRTRSPPNYVFRHDRKRLLPMVSTNKLSPGPPRRPAWEADSCCRGGVQPDVRADHHPSRRVHDAPSSQRDAHDERVHLYHACHAARHRRFREAQPGRDDQGGQRSQYADTYVPLLQTERLAGNEPMIDETYDVLTPTLEVDGLIGDLTPDLKMGKPYPQNYWLPTFEASYIPPKGAPFGVGQVFALANEADATVIMYNENEFKAAGVPFPQNGWTWSQMLADAAKLKVGSGSSQTQYGICERPDWQAEYNPVLKAYGVTAFTETKATLDTPAALKAWAADDRPHAQRRRRARGSAAGQERVLRLRAVLRVR